MKSMIKVLGGSALLAATSASFAAVDVGQSDKQATNWVAIILFASFVALTLWITKWAAART